MGFIRTPEEIEAIQRALAAPRFGPGVRLLVEFTTEPEAYARLLPPGLDPGPEPVVIAGIGRWHSNCVGDYCGGSVSLLAAHDGVPGTVALGMWMDSGPAVLFGREVFGEPKTVAAADVGIDGGRAYAWIERDGVRIVELEAELGEDLGPATSAGIAYNYRSRTGPDGTLDGPAQLTAATFRESATGHREGTGTVTLRATPHDPFDELPVVAVRRAGWREHTMDASCRVVATVPEATFLPWHFGRMDDVLALDTAGTAAV